MKDNGAPLHIFTCGAGNLAQLWALIEAPQTEAEAKTAVVASSLSASLPPPPQAGCHTDPFHIRFAENPSLSLNQTSTGGAACNLTYTTGSPGSASIASGPSRGTLSQLDPLNLKYQPNTGFKGSDHYTIKLCDRAGCAAITYNVTIK
jgi:hypothetical protein